MITQQAAAFLIKKVTAAVDAADMDATDDIDGDIKMYLKGRQYSDKRNNFNVLQSDRAIVDAFRFRAACLAVKAHEKRVVEGRSWNGMLVELHELSNAHSEALLVENFSITPLPPLQHRRTASGDSKTNTLSAIPALRSAHAARLGAIIPQLRRRVTCADGETP